MYAKCTIDVRLHMCYKIYYSVPVNSYSDVRLACGKIQLEKKSGILKRLHSVKHLNNPNCRIQSLEGMSIFGLKSKKRIFNICVYTLLSLLFLSICALVKDYPVE